MDPVLTTTERLDSDLTDGHDDIYDELCLVLGSGSDPPRPTRPAAGMSQIFKKKNYPHDPLRVVQDIRTRPALIKRVKQVTRPNKKNFFLSKSQKMTDKHNRSLKFKQHI